MGVLLRWVSLRRLIRSPLRSLLVLFGIALGVATVISTFATNQSIRGAFVEMAARVAGKADLIVSHGDVGVPLELVEQIDDLPEVAHVAGTLEIITQEPQNTGPILILGLDFLGDRHFINLSGDDAESEELVDDPIAFVNDPDAILVSRSFAEPRGLKIGGELKLMTPDGPRAFVVRGILKDEGLAAAFGGRIALMFQEAALAAFGGEDRFDRIEVALEKGADREVVRGKINALLAGRGRVEEPEGRTQHLTSILEPIERGLQIAGVLALLVGMFIIYNAVGVAVAERRREVGVLRALGVSRSGVVRMFCAEAFVLAILGGALGVLLGGVIARFALEQAVGPVSRFYAPIRPPAPEVGFELAITALLAGLGATVLAAYAPARLAATIDPAESLRRQPPTLRRGPLPHRAMMISGLILFFPAFLASRADTLAIGFVSMGLFLAAALLCIPALIIGLRRILLGVISAVFKLPGRIAADNAERRLDRSALTVGALMLAVSSSVALGAWGESLEAGALNWLDRALPADLYVTAGSPVADQHNIPFRPEILDLLENAPGVRDAYPVRVVTLDVRDKRLVLVAVDMKDYSAANERKNMAAIVLDGPDPIPLETMLAQPTILLSENASRKLKLRAGESLTLETPSGPQPFLVQAVIVDYSSDQGSAIIDRRWYLQFWDDPMIDTVDLLIEDGARLEEVAANVRQLVGREDLFVVSAGDLRVEIERILVDSMRIFRSTELIALLVALLGVIGTMLAAVLDRTREIGVLRAIGATRRQIASAVMVEAGFLGLASAVGGIIAGVPMGYVFVKTVGLAGTGWSFEYVFPVAGALRIALLVTATAALAGLWPGRRAAGMNVPEALAYE